MLIRYQILLLSVISCVGIGVATFLIQQNQVQQQEESLSEVSTTLFDASWSDTSESSYITHLEKWNPDGFSINFKDIFGTQSDLSFWEYETGAVNQAIDSSDTETAFDILDYIFSEEFDEENLSFAIVYGKEGDKIFCGFAFDYGLDPCGTTSVIDYQAPLDEFLERSVRAKRQVVFVDDVTGSESSTIHQSIVFPVRNSGKEKIATVVLGRNIFSNLEVFEEQYEVRAAVVTPDYDLSLENYVQVQEGEFEIYDLPGLVSEGKSVIEERNSRLFTENATEKGASITVISLSDYLPGGRANLMIFRDQRAEFDARDQIELGAYGAIVFLTLLIASVVGFVITRAFSGITSAIDVLNSLTNQDLEAEMKERTGILASEQDEVGQLKRSLESYRESLLENRSISENNYRRRKERDTLIISKMGDLADKLDGEAKNLMLGDIKRMNELSEQESEGDTREDASIEMMSLAFSRMSDEVLQLIDAKTEDMKSARDEAITANANRSQFFANMSHELRTPLNAIIGYSEMLEEECEDMGHDDLLPDVQRINSSGRHLLTLINDVLDMQKIEAGKMEIYPTAFDVDGTIEMLNAINMPLSEKTGNAYVVERSDDVAGAFFQDETKLRQIVTNYLSNAFKNTESGTVTLKITKEAEPKNGLEMVRFAVQDTGTGIPEEALAGLFDEYTQVQTSTMAKSAQVQASTGLGLSVTKKLAIMMGGDVEVESEVGTGSIFSLVIPRRLEDEEETGEELPDVEDSTKPYVVLIDDDPNVHEMVKRTLNKANINLIGATDGERGLQIIRERLPQLILLDVYMSGRDGWSILREVKSDPELQDIPVAMVTQLSEEKFAESLGAEGYFTKPIDRSTFIPEIHRLLGTQKGDVRNVLVVDDDANTRELLQRMLTDEGFTADSAEDGMVGLEKVTAGLGKKDSARLIILDIEMPRMDGLQFLDAYAEQVPEEKHVPIVIFSGKDMSATQEELLSQFPNVKAFVPKGDMSNLSSLINQLELDKTA